jgi:hypothetical protein
VNPVVIVLAVVVVMALVIARQLKGEPLRGRRVILLPAVLIVIGAVDLHSTRHLNVADVICIGIGAVTAAAIGLVQGRTLRLELRDGGLWGQMPVSGLWWWGALIVSRLVMAGIAIPLGAHAVMSTDSILLVLGVNRMVQAAVITYRATSAGIPFAAEKDGKAFLPGLLGQSSTQAFVGSDVERESRSF